MAVTEVLVGKAALLRAKEQGHATHTEAFSNQPRSLPQVAHSVLRVASPQRRRTNHQRTVRDGLLQRFELFSLLQQSCGSHGRTRFTKRQLIGIHHAQMPKPKVAHRARHRADVQRVPRVHQPHAQPFKFAFSKQTFFGQGVSNLCQQNLCQPSRRRARSAAARQTSEAIQRYAELQQNRPLT